MSTQPASSFASKMNAFFRSLNCCGGSADEDEPRAIVIVSPRTIITTISKINTPQARDRLTLLSCSPDPPTSAAKTSPCPASRPPNSKRSARRPAPTPPKCGTTCNHSPPRPRRNSPNALCRLSSNLSHRGRRPCPPLNMISAQASSSRPLGTVRADEAATTGPTAFEHTRARFRTRSASPCLGMRRWGGRRGRAVRMR